MDERDDRIGAGREDDGGDASGHIDVVALVLGDVDGQRRGAMAAHLLACRTCRSEYDDLSATVGDLLPAVPAVQPPLGFDERVLGRLAVDRPPRRVVALRRWVLAAAAAVLVLAGVAVWATAGGDDTGRIASSVRPLELVDGGADVGTVSIGQVDGSPVMVVAIVDAPDGVSYRCRTTFEDGTTTDTAAWPAGNGAWIVPIGAEVVRSVDLLVDGTDDVWSSASFDT